MSASTRGMFQELWIGNENECQNRSRHIKIRGEYVIKVLLRYDDFVKIYQEVLLSLMKVRSVVNHWEKWQEFDGGGGPNERRACETALHSRRCVYQ